MLKLKKMITHLIGAKSDATLLERASDRILAVQRKAADFLNEKTAGWSSRKMKVLLVVFCMVSVNAILLIAGRAVLSANGPPKGIKVQGLLRPGPLSIKRDSLPKKINH